MYRAREVNIIHSIHMLQKAKMPKASSLISILEFPACQTRLKSFGGFSVRRNYTIKTGADRSKQRYECSWLRGIHTCESRISFHMMGLRITLDSTA